MKKIELENGKSLLVTIEMSLLNSKNPHKGFNGDTINVILMIKPKYDFCPDGNLCIVLKVSISSLLLSLFLEDRDMYVICTSCYTFPNAIYDFPNNWY